MHAKSKFIAVSWNAFIIMVTDFGTNMHDLADWVAKLVQILYAALLIKQTVYILVDILVALSLICQRIPPGYSLVLGALLGKPRPPEVQSAMQASRHFFGQQTP